MIGVFVYGELVAKRNFQLIVDTPVRDKVERAKLLGHQLVITTGDYYAAKPYALGCIEGLLYYLDEEQVKSIINYYGVNFRLSTGTAKINGIERSVKFMVTTSGVGFLGTCSKADVEQRLLSTSALYSDNENERHYIQSTLQYLFPNRVPEWIASNYPYYVKWLRSVGFDANYMLPSIQGIEYTDDLVIKALIPLMPEQRANIRSITTRGSVVEPISLSLANKIDSYAKALSASDIDLDVTMSSLGIDYVERNMPHVDTDDLYNALKSYCDYAEGYSSIKDRMMFLLLVLKSLDLPLIDLSGLEDQELNAFIMNKLYVEYLLEG